MPSPEEMLDSTAWYQAAVHGSAVSASGLCCVQAVSRSNRDATHNGYNLFAVKFKRLNSLFLFDEFTISILSAPLQ